MKPGDWSGLDHLQPSELTYRLLENVDACLKAWNGLEDEDRFLAALPAPLGVLYLLNWLQFELMQGGMTTYLMNSHGRYASETVAALRTIGADRLAGIVERAQQVQQAHLEAWKVRRTELDELPAFAVGFHHRGLMGTDELEALTDEFYDTHDEEWDERLDAFLVANLAPILSWAHED